jgi:hypothetical protein
VDAAGGDAAADRGLDRAADGDGAEVDALADALAPEAAGDSNVESEASGDSKAGQDADAGKDADAPGDSSPPAPFTALVAVQEHASAAAGTIVANAGFSTIYELAVPAQKGDVLRVRGQVEMTNDYSAPVRGHIRLRAGGATVGTTASQNDVPNGAHHMPMWADAIVLAPSAGTIALEAQYAATRSGASPSVKIEDGYGHILVEQYRAFGSRAEAQAAGALGLVAIGSDRTENAAAFGGTFAQRTLAYSLDQAVLAGDLVRVLGMATSGWNPNGLEMHGQGLFEGGATRISPWSTENTPWEIQTVPLFTDAVSRPQASSTAAFAVSMHGVTGLGGPIVAGGGHLHAMVFRKLSLAPGARGLVRSDFAPGAGGDQLLTTNTGWHDLVSRPVAGLRAGDVVRITGHLQMARTGSFALGISCQARTQLRDGQGGVVDGSALSSKYITQMLEVLPLRTEQVVTAAKDGDYAVVLSAVCTREAASPDVLLPGGGSSVVVEVWR